MKSRYIKMIGDSRAGILVDLDGTLCDTRHRAYMVTTQDETDWDAYSLACTQDIPVFPVIHLVRMLYEAGYFIAIASGRSEVAREFTIAWLEDFDIPYDALYMREKGDLRSNGELKREFVAHLTDTEGVVTKLAIDDYEKVAGELLVLGVQTLLVQPNTGIATGATVKMGSY